MWSNNFVTMNEGIESTCGELRQPASKWTVLLRHVCYPKHVQLSRSSVSPRTRTSKCSTQKVKYTKTFWALQACSSVTWTGIVYTWHEFGGNLSIHQVYSCTVVKYMPLGRIYLWLTMISAETWQIRLLGSNFFAEPVVGVNSLLWEVHCYSWNSVSRWSLSKIVLHLSKNKL